MSTFRADESVISVVVNTKKEGWGRKCNIIAFLKGKSALPLRCRIASPASQKCLFYAAGSQVCHKVKAACALLLGLY